MEELEDAQELVGEFGADNRAGIEGTLHRISAIRNRKGFIVGLTCRVGRAVSGHIDMLYDLLHYGKSILFVGRYFSYHNLLSFSQCLIELNIIGLVLGRPLFCVRWLVSCLMNSRKEWWVFVAFLCFLGSAF